jgi:membrane protein implicated in regulation of membrane protease activity
MFGKLHPILGGIATLAIAALIAYFSMKVKKEKTEEQNKKSGETIGDRTGKDQDTVGQVQDKLDDFLK